jgi:hypothetical protein
MSSRIERQKDIQIRFSRTDKSSELTLVLTPHLLKSNNGGSLLVYDSAKTSLAFDDNIRNTHLAAECG